VVATQAEYLELTLAKEFQNVNDLAEFSQIVRE
jgi:hypothetical protein